MSSSSSSVSPTPVFAGISDYVQRLGGKCAINRILIANNGIAAVKAIRSIRRWAFETFGNEHEVSNININFFFLNFISVGFLRLKTKNNLILTHTTVSGIQFRGKHSSVVCIKYIIISHYHVCEFGYRL
jgi:hypothetical protein